MTAKKKPRAKRDPFPMPFDEAIQRVIDAEPYPKDVKGKPTL